MRGLTWICCAALAAVAGCDGQNQSRPESSSEPVSSSQPPSSATSVSGVAARINSLLGANPSPQLADKLEDVAAKVKTADTELAKTPPDNQAALGAMEGAVGDLEAAVKDGVLDLATGTELMGSLTTAARELAGRAIEQAVARNGKASDIADARTALAEAEGLRASAKFKDAVAKYRAALAKAESA